MSRKHTHTTPIPKTSDVHLREFQQDDPYMPIYPHSTSRIFNATPIRLRSPDGTDKAYRLRECVTTILNFCSARKYPGDLPSEKQLLKPPAQQLFRNLMQFLINEVNPNFVMEKFDTDVPSFFKEIGYIHTIKRSDMTAPTAPPTWPTHLYAMEFLCHLLQDEETNQDIFQPLYLSQDASEIEKVETELFMRVTEQYKVWNSGKDINPSDLLEHFWTKTTKEVENWLEDEKNQLEHYKQFMQVSLEKKTKEASLRSEIEIMKEQEQERKNEITQLKTKHDFTVKEKKAKEEYLSTLSNQLSDLKHDIQDLTCQVQSQEINVEEKDNLLEDIERNKKKRQDYINQLEKTEPLVRKEEDTLSQQKELLCYLLEQDKLSLEEIRCSTEVAQQIPCLTTIYNSSEESKLLSMLTERNKALECLGTKLIEATENSKNKLEQLNEAHTIAQSRYTVPEELKRAKRTLDEQESNRIQLEEEWVSKIKVYQDQLEQYKQQVQESEQFEDIAFREAEGKLRATTAEFEEIKNIWQKEAEESELLMKESEEALGKALKSLKVQTRAHLANGTAANENFSNQNFLHS